jgi:hypothetical protein
VLRRTKSEVSAMKWGAQQIPLLVTAAILALSVGGGRLFGARRR